MSSPPMTNAAPRPCIVSFAQDAESSCGKDPDIGMMAKQEGATVENCPRSRSLNSPRKLKQVHFKELDECLSTLSIADRDSCGAEAPEVGTRGAENENMVIEATSPTSDAEDLPSGKKEKRLKLHVSDEQGAGAGTFSPFAQAVGPKSPSLFRHSSNSSGDYHINHQLPRTTCSTPGTATPSASISPLSWSSLRDSSTASPTDRVSSCGEAAPALGSRGEVDVEGDDERDGPASIRKAKPGLLYERRGRPSPLQLSVKRSRGVQPSRTWTGKREQVLGAEPGTPRLSKCDTL